MEQLQTALSQFYALSIEFFSRPEVLSQLGLIAAFFPLALLLDWRIQPILETSVRQIKGMPGLLRIAAAFLRRLKWLFFVALLSIAYVAAGSLSWFGDAGIIYLFMLLALAWLTIAVLSQTIRNRAVSRLFAILAWAYVAAAVLGISDDIALLLDKAGFQLGAFRFSVLKVMEAGILLGVLMWLASSVGNFLDRRIQRSEDLTPSLRVLIGKVLRISLIALAVVLTVSGLGIDLTAFTVLSGAIGVGIGFGLQKVVSNFISGIIILMDQSIKPGDTISLGETFGWIRELRARFVSVVTRDGREYLIPNEDFITTQVVNWSFSDDLVRVDISFGVAYDSDPHEVSQLAIEAASSVGRVITEGQTPVCWVTGFGDFSIDFTLRFWIADPQNGLTNIRGLVLLALWDSFKAHGITIPFPHREIIMRTPVTIESGD